ncbi:MAG: quinolinate synthase NadA, partial [Halobacteriovoraceae bacterium]|nr:quinolinate synthase NadA [Halobacteriovoraceae bacterium]
MINIYEENQDHLPTIQANDLSDEQVLTELFELKKDLGEQVVVLGHHYQQDDVISLADHKGDSLQLAKEAAKLSAKYIIFCGVHFMAETADMLTSEDQHVILPDMNAGCSMADMANRSEIDRAWKNIKSCTNDTITPITYINCDAQLKDFVGANGGAICTSSNAEKVITWALKQGEKLLFFPDQHLGRNTCSQLGIELDEMIVYDPNKQFGGVTPEQIK